MENHRALYSLGGLALLALLFIVITMLLNAGVRNARIDLTENDLYTLSDGTERLVENLQLPVTLYYFFSEDPSGDLPQVRAYAARVADLLSALSDQAGDRLTVRRVDPLPFSEAEDEAARFGLQGVPVNAAGETLYFGIAGTNTLDGVATIPFLDPSKEAFLEYDLAKLIYSLSQPEAPRVGLLTGLPMGGDFNPASGQMSEPWAIRQQLDELFQVEDIAMDAERLPEGLDLLVLVHPKSLPQPLLYAIDQYVLNGGNVIAFLDPLAEADRPPPNPNDPTGQFSATPPSDLGPLLPAWGVGFDPTRVVGDLRYALEVGTGPGRPPSRHLTILGIGEEHLDDDDVVTADLELVNLSSAGYFSVLDTAAADDGSGAGAAPQLQPLLTSSANAGLVDAARLRFLGDPAELLRGFNPSGDIYPLAVRVSGPIRSAFPDGPPEGAEAVAASPSDAEPGSIVLVADTDLLSDRLWVQRQSFFGQTLLSPFADNGDLVVNGVDNLLGNAALISIRARASSRRPFGRVDELRLSAEQRYRATEEQLQRELEETEGKLNTLQTSRQDGDLTVLTPEQEAELDRFLERRLEIRRELRQVRRNLDQDIEALGTRLKLLNIVLVPLLVAGLAFFLAWRRRQRHGGVSS